MRSLLGSSGFRVVGSARERSVAGSCPDSGELNLAGDGSSNKKSSKDEEEVKHWSPFYGLGRAFWYGILGPFAIGFVVTAVGGDFPDNKKDDLAKALAAIRYVQGQVEVIQAVQKRSKSESNMSLTSGESDSLDSVADLSESNPSAFTPAKNALCKYADSNGSTSGDDFMASLTPKETVAYDVAARAWNELGDSAAENPPAGKCEEVISIDDLCGGSSVP
jgi:hypothetical protein